MPDARWIRLGGLAGIAYVLIAVAAGTLSGTPPEANGVADTYRQFVIEKHTLLVTQGWLYALIAPLMLTFAVTVRRVLRGTNSDGYLAELFLVGTATIAALDVVAMAMQIAVAQRAAVLPAEVVFTVGVHFVGVLIGLWGFIMANTALAFAISVFAHGGLPHWTAYSAVVAAVTSLTATAGVFVGTGAFSLEGGFSAWAPAVTTVVWYLGTSISLLRLRNSADATPDSMASAK